jgi:hypothetical protein
MAVEELVQNRRWKKSFGEFSKKRFNGFLVNILLSFANDCWRIKLTIYDTTKTTLHSDIDEVRYLNQLHILETVKVYLFWLLKNISSCKCYALETDYNVLYMKF